jgi:hypothetical protein
VADTIVYFDWLMHNGRKRVENPAGFLIALIQDDLPVSFVSPPHEAESAADAAAEIERRSRAELDYAAFVDAAVNRAVKQMGDLQFEGRVQEKISEFKTSDRANIYRTWSPEMLRSHAILFVRKQIAVELALPGFEAWVEQRGR